MKKKLTRLTLAMITAVICVFVCGFIFLCSQLEADADSVTDTLTIKIGYWGMDESDYVEKATYHWSQLDDMYGGALTTHNVAYSFFQEADKGSYRTVVSSARGFYLDDLFDYAGVNMSKIKNVSFYTADHGYGAYTSFTYSQLFSQQRYYFDDLASNINNEYNSAGVLTGYNLDSSVWDNKTAVRPMLALESNWYTYEAGQEHTAPDFNSMSAGSRFRLLYGQTSPTEQRTSQSAKYVHTVAITVPGSPEVVTKKIKLSNQVGKHQVTFDVASDEAMLSSLMKYLVWTSSDESVLKIGNVDMKKNEKYSDAVTVTLHYEVLKKGAASISGSYMGTDVSGTVISNGVKDDESGDGEGDNKGGGLALGELDGNDNSGSGGGKKSSSLYAMGDDFLNAMEQQDAARTVTKDDSQKYMPYVFGGMGILILLGAGVMIMEFRNQTERCIRFASLKIKKING